MIVSTPSNPNRKKTQTMMINSYVTQISQISQIILSHTEITERLFRTRIYRISTNLFYNLELEKVQLGGPKGKAN